ncbi:MAG: hypothetical protein ACREJQ_02250 [bacterium]
MTLQVEGVSGVTYGYAVYLPKAGRSATGARLGAFSGRRQLLFIAFPRADPPGYKPASVHIEW